MADPSADTLRHVLLIEDSPDDIVLVKRAFRDQQMLDRLSVAEDGEAALAFLRREGAHANAPTPTLILLDLGLPKQDGRAVLEAIRSDPALRHIPVVITTTSRAQEDAVKSLNLNVQGYLPKPVAVEELLTIMKHVRPPAPPA